MVGVGDVAASVHAPRLPQPQTVPEVMGAAVYGLGEGVWGGDELLPWPGSSSPTRGRFPEGVIQK